MSKCSGYGTLLGCSRCYVDLANDDDISRLSAVSIFSILLRLMETPRSQTTELFPENIEILCNGIIRLPDYSSRRTCSKEISWKNNKSTYNNILQRWKDTHESYIVTNDIHGLIVSYIEEVQLAYSFSNLLMVLREGLSKLEVVCI